MKRGDKILIIIILAIIGISLFQILKPDKVNKILIIRSDGKVIKQINLNTSKDTEFVVKSREGHLTVEIKNGKVRVINSTCKDKLCIKEGWISRSGESIVCLPNRISISITGQNDQPVDSITY